MIHFGLLLICILSVEVLIRFNLLLILDSILKVARKAIYIIPRDAISDHWKEKVIPVYGLRMMWLSLQVLLILLLILSLFFIAEYFFNDFLARTLSLFGIIESMAFVIGYRYVRRSLVK